MVHIRISGTGPAGKGLPTTAPIQVRSPEIMQGIGNIVQNAVSFARCEVLISTRWTTEWAEVEVSDDGPGVPESERARIFERFVRLDPARARHQAFSTAICAGAASRSSTVAIVLSHATDSVAPEATVVLPTPPEPTTTTMRRSRRSGVRSPLCGSSPAMATAGRVAARGGLCSGRTGICGGAAEGVNAGGPSGTGLSVGI